MIEIKNITETAYWTQEIEAQHEAWLEVLDQDKVEVDGYELLYTRIDATTTDGEDITFRGIEWLNGARVNPTDNIKHEMTYCHEKDNNSGAFKIVECSFEMPSQFKYIGDLFTQMPWGIIKKNRTGLGATTLELSSPRHSIVVVPTRTLAYEKAKNSRIADTNKYRVLYYGGRITGFNVPTVRHYLQDNEIYYKKIIVVIDSLDRLLEEIGESNWKDYFIMFDEIDSYQYDSWYRPNMEKNFEYYFKFPSTQRCLVSATLGEFSNPKIQAEPVINIKFPISATQQISLLETNNPTMTAVDQIIKLSQDHPNDKILVAYNLVTRGILPIILCLPEKLRNECSVLCSEKSRKHVKDYYKEVIENNLPSRITFISCTFFVGIDFKDRFHLLSIANTSYPFTLLSTDKLQQISGRCRNQDGTLSETLIFNTTKSPISLDYDKLSAEFIKDAQLLISLSDSMGKVSKTFPRLLKPFRIIFLEEFVKNSLKGYMGSSEVRCVRVEGEHLEISFFNIDNALIQIKLLHTIYATLETLKDALESKGYELLNISTKSNEKDIPSEVVKYVDDLKSEDEQAEINYIIEELKAVSSYDERIKLAQTRRTGTLNKVSQYLERFIELHKFVPFESLVTILSLEMSRQEYEHLYNAVIFWALDDEHGFKKAWKELFIIGEKYKGNEIKEKVNTLWNGLLQFGILSNVQAMRITKKYFTTLEKTTQRIDGNQPTRVYEVKDLNPIGLPHEHNNIIPPTENIQNLIIL